MNEICEREADGEDTATPGTLWMLAVSGLLLPGCAAGLLQVATGEGGAGPMQEIWLGHEPVGGSSCCIADAPDPCNQSDSTVTCCLKKHPGEQERCAALAEPQPKPKPSTSVPPSGGHPVPLVPEPEDPYKKERCINEYEACVTSGKARLPGRVHGETLCGSCMAYCTAYGFWPDAIYTWKGDKIPCRF